MAKVGKKVFVFLGRDDEAVVIAVKLPHSGPDALSLPFTEPTHHGYGRHGWVSVSLESNEEASIELLKEWILESYRAVAPKRLVKELDPGD